MTGSRETPQPPPAPEIDRHFRLYRWQWVGLPLLLLLPILALFGVFGHTWEDAHATGEELEMDVHYPSRFRYKEVQTMSVRVRNRSDRILDRVFVSFDSSYINRFSTVRFEPDADTPYEVELLEVMPGESRLVKVELQGEEFWRHSGTIRAERPGGAGAEVPVSTIIFP